VATKTQELPTRVKKDNTIANNNMALPRVVAIVFLAGRKKEKEKGKIILARCCKNYQVQFKLLYMFNVY
jgi:hypothetical protein